MGQYKDEPQAITLARLKVAPPELVFDELKTFNDKAGYGDVFEELESALQARKHPLIDLALARYGASTVVSALYNKALAGTGDAQQDNAIRIAVLGNRILPRISFGHAKPPIPSEELRRLAESGDREEVEVMLRNPSCGELLEDLYQRKAPFDDLQADRLCELVYASIPNARVNVDESDENGPDLLNWGIHKGIWQLLATSPISKNWLWTLGYLLLQIDPARTHTSEIDVKAVLDRWAALVVKKTFKPNEDEEGFYTELSLVDEFRCLVAALYGKVYKDGKFEIVGSKDSQDVALRCAYYGNESMTPEEMQACLNRDGDTFVFAALCNDSLFHKQKCRALLEDMISGDLRRRYAERCEQIAKRWKSFDPRPISESGVAVLEDILPDQQLSAEAQGVARLEAKIAELASKLEETKSRAAWVLIGIVALLVWKY